MCLPFTAPWAATCELREQLQLRQSCALLLPVARWRVLSGWCERRADSLSTQSLALPWPFSVRSSLCVDISVFTPPPPARAARPGCRKWKKQLAAARPCGDRRRFALRFRGRAASGASGRVGPVSSPLEVRAPVDQNVCQNNGLILGTRYVVYSKTHTHTSVSSDIQAITTLTLQEMLRGSR